MVFYYYLTANIPDITVNVISDRVSPYAWEEHQNYGYSIGTGQEFGLVCNTSENFTVSWYYDKAGTMKGDNLCCV